MKKMMGCIMCLLLIGTNNSEVMCGLRQYAHYRLKVNEKSKTHQKTSSEEMNYTS